MSDKNKKTAPPSSTPRTNILQAKDWHASLGSLALKAEKGIDSMERMLAVCRCYIAFLTHLFRPSLQYRDTPTVIVGHHYLSHRELGIIHKGDNTRVYLQELCCYDPENTLLKSSKYSLPGHIDISTWRLHLVPTAKPGVRKEGFMGTSSQAYIEVELGGQGSIRFERHDEDYTFTFPSILLTSPLSNECPIDMEGVCKINCASTGLRTLLKFKPWSGGTVKGDVRRLEGDGQVKAAKIEGSWQSNVNVYGLDPPTEGMLYDSNDVMDTGASAPPPDGILAVNARKPFTINLTRPGPCTAHRLWSSILESVLYMDKADAEKAGKLAVAMAAALPEALASSLLYEPVKLPGVKAGNRTNNQATEFSEEQLAILASDTRPLPPTSKFQRSMGRTLHYQLQYIIQAIEYTALQTEEQKEQNGQEET